MALTVYFFGSLPNGVEPYYGGGEVGNKRTVDMLRQFGFKVRIVRKLRCKLTASQFVKLITYPFRAAIGVGAFLGLLLFGSRKAIVHISGFYGPTIFFEYLLTEAANILGYKIIYEMRGGGAESYHKTGSAFYRFCFARIVRKVKVIFSQGVENEPLLKSISDTPIFYYPNYVEASYLPSALPQKPENVVNLIYFGRIEPQKNVKLIVEAAAILQKKTDISLTIIGKGQYGYVGEVIRQMEQTLKPGTYTFISGYARIGIRNILLDKHFLIYPSTLEREGQSNAVTESMSCGVVPISSPQGFSRTVIGNDRLIINELSAQNYADRVLEILADGSYSQLSQFVYERIKSNYTQAVIEPKLREQYERLWGGVRNLHFFAHRPHIIVSFAPILKQNEMHIISKKADLADYLKQCRANGKTIGFVPTMGALHEGHLSLVQRSLSECDVTVVSVFVNPTQFNDKNDLQNYPRCVDKDCALLESVGCNAVFTPSVEEMYPEPDTRVFSFDGLDKVMEGEHRPGHFNGVAQVVSKLFDIVQPDKAFFGMKDFQQVAIIKNMVRQLGLKVQIVPCPIIREDDGLAKSSRNMLLTPEHRTAAPTIHKTLFEATTMKDDLKPDQLCEWITKTIDANGLLQTEYVQIVDFDTLMPISEFDGHHAIACIAVWAGKVRLIDNIEFC